MRPTTIYVASAPSGIVKVGMTADMSKREPFLKYRAGGDVVVNRTWRHERAIAIESICKDRLQMHRAKGTEWFRLTVDDLVDTVERAIRDFDNKGPQPRVILPATGDGMDALAKAYLAEGRDFDDVAGLLGYAVSEFRNRYTSTGDYIRTTLA